MTQGGSDLEHPLVDQQRCPRFEDSAARPDEWHRDICQPNAAFDDIREADKVSRDVVDGDVHGLRIEDLVDLLADQVVHRLHVELGGKALLDAVDDCQLSCPLISLGQEPFRLVEQSRVLESDAHARRQGREQPLVGLAVGVALQPLESDNTDDPVGTEDRHAEEGFRLGTADLQSSERIRFVVGTDPDWLSGLDDA